MMVIFLQETHLLRFQIFIQLRTAFTEPGLNTDAGQFSVEFYIYTSLGGVRAWSIFIFLQAAHG